MWPENLIVTISINNSYSRYCGAHVRDVAFILLACNISRRARQTHQQLSSQLTVSLRLEALQSWSCC